MIDLADAERVLTEALAVVRALREEIAPVAEREEPDIVAGWISERHAAELAGITTSGMAKHRARGSSPDNRTLHGHIVYRKSEVLQWIAARARHGLVRSTGLDGVEGGDDGE